MSYLTDLGTALRDARKALGLTQAQLAERAGLTRSTVCLMERAMISDLGVRKVAALCEAAGLELTTRPLPGPQTLPELYAEHALAEAEAFRQTDALIAALHRAEALPLASGRGHKHGISR